MYYFEIYLGNKCIDVTTDARKAERMEQMNYTVICKMSNNNKHSERG